MKDSFFFCLIMERFIYEIDIAYSTTTVLLPKRFDAHSDWLPVFPSMRNGELVLEQDGVSSQASSRLESGDRSWVTELWRIQSAYIGAGGLHACWRLCCLFEVTPLVTGTKVVSFSNS